MTRSPWALRPEVRDYYERADEGERLGTGPFRLEFARSREVIGRSIPAPPAKVLDVGGAAGPYSLWLAGLGYETHLVDPVPQLVEQARARSDAADDPIASCAVGDARALEWSDRSVDVVLELGPLYHLPDRDERLVCLREARRVLRPGGPVVVAAISRFSPLLGGLSEGLLCDPDFAGIVERDLATGVHRNDTGRLEYFTTAFLHRPAELADEVREAGFEEVRVLGVEGPGWLLPDFEERWSDPEGREQLLRAARLLEDEPAMAAVSAHLLAVGVKPARS